MNIGPLELLMLAAIPLVMIVVAFVAGYGLGKARGYRQATIDAKKA
jgi:hypothetical protein